MHGADNALTEGAVEWIKYDKVNVVFIYTYVWLCVQEKVGFVDPRLLQEACRLIIRIGLYSEDSQVAFRNNVTFL